MLPGMPKGVPVSQLFSGWLHGRALRSLPGGGGGGGRFFFGGSVVSQPLRATTARQQRIRRATPWAGIDSGREMRCFMVE